MITLEAKGSEGCATAPLEVAFAAHGTESPSIWCQNQFLGLLQLTQRQWENLHSVPVFAAVPAMLPHFWGNAKPSFPCLYVFSLHAISALAHLTIHYSCLSSVWILYGISIQRQKPFSLLLCCQSGLPPLPADAGFVLFPIQKECKHRHRPQQFQFLLACITSLSGCWNEKLIQLFWESCFSSMVPVLVWP